MMVDDQNLWAMENGGVNTHISNIYDKLPFAIS